MDQPEIDNGSDLKSIWRKVSHFPLVVLLVALAVVAIALILAGLTVSALGKPDGDLATYAIPILFSVPLTLFAMKLVVSRLGECPRDDLPFDRRINDLWRGAIGAALLMSAIVGLAAAFGGYRIIGWGTGDSWEMLLFFAGIQAAFVEEVIFRGIIFRFVEDFAGSWAALILSALMFGFLHATNPNASLLSSFAIAVEAGILLGGAYMLTRNLWLAIGVHFGWNFVQGFVWDVPVSGMAVDGMIESRPVGPDLISGGAFGLEASIVAMVLATAAGAWLVWLAARRGQVVKPWWVRRRAG